MIPPSSSLTLVNMPQADATPPVDPSVTLAPPPSNDAALVVVASALTQPSNAPAPPSVADDLFANFTPATPLAPPPAVPDAAPQGGSSGGSAVSLATVPATPPGPGAPPAGPTSPPLVVPPPGMNLPAPPVANADSYNVVGGSLTVPASSGLLANDTNPTGQPLTANVVNTPVYGSVAVNPDGSFTYTNTNPGLTQTVTFTYVASAGGLISNPATVTLNLNAPTPAAPTLLNPGDQASNTGEPVSLQLVGTGPAGDALAYSAAGLPSGLSVDPASGEIGGSIDHSASLTNAVTATATDTVTGLSASQSFTWVVTVVSHAPTLAPIDDRTNSAGDAVDLWANGGSVDGSPLTYSIAGQPSGVGIDLQSGEIAGNIANSAFGSTPYQVTVTVSDGTLSASQTFAWSVSAIQLTNPGDQTNAIGNAVSLPLAVQDYAGGTPTFTATGLPNGLTIDQATGLISGSVSAGTVWQGDFSVTVTATDGTNTASQTFDWTVTPASNATAPAIANAGAQTNYAGATVSLPIQANSPNGALTYSGVGLPDGLTIDPVSGVIGGTTTAQAVGTSTVTVAVVDPLGGSASTTFSWVVNPASIMGQGIDVTEDINGVVIDQPIATFQVPAGIPSMGIYTAMIDWGDGGPTSAGNVEYTNGQYTVWGGHLYGKPDSYLVQVTIKNQFLNCGVVVPLIALAPGAPPAAVKSHLFVNNKPVLEDPVNDPVYEAIIFKTQKVSRPIAKEILNVMIESKVENTTYKYKDANDLYGDILRRIAVIKAANDLASLSKLGKVAFSPVNGQLALLDTAGTAASLWVPINPPKSILKGIGLKGSTNADPAGANLGKGLDELYSKTAKHLLKLDCTSAVSLAVVRGLYLAEPKALTTGLASGINNLYSKAAKPWPPGVVIIGFVSPTYDLITSSPPGVKTNEDLTTAKPMDKIPGDVRVFINFGAKASAPNYRLENAIYLGGGKYYAHPFGVTDAKSIVAALKEMSNTPDEVKEAGVSRRPQIPK